MQSVLVVEGDGGVANALERALVTEEGLSVLAAPDPDVALEILGTRPVDLIITDHSMPRGDALSLLRRIKQLLPDIPRMLIAEDTTLTPERVLETLGDPVPVIPRPWKEDELRSMVREALSLRDLDLEEAVLMQHAGVTKQQIERARRIQKRMQTHQSLGEVLVGQGVLPREALERTLQIRRSQMSIVELLVEDGRLSADQLAHYREAKRIAPGLDTRALLVEGGLVTEEAYLQALCTKYGIPYVEPEVGGVDPNLLDKTSFRYLMRHHALPVSLTGDVMTVILADPLDTFLIGELERNFGVEVHVQCASAAKIDDALNTLQRIEGEAEEGSTSVQYREIEQIDDVEETGEEAVQIVDYLLLRAVQLSASDLHIEPQQNQIRVRVRIDGVLQHLTNLPVSFAPRIVSRLKILAHADISEKRLHQDGKICIKVEGREIDIRVSIYVTVFGETIVMRLLDRNRGIVPLEKIGFTPKVYSALTEVVLEASSGLVLLVGPTGSGKTTTLYSFIDYANDPSEKVITCEDPVEYVIDGVTHCSVNDKTGPTFADSLRAIVRQDPDTIIVGEIRDNVTASLALEAALTGHKVFSTFHTEEAVGAFVRLLEMGIEPFLVASTVSAVIAQRLIRRICTNCRKPYQPSRSELRFLGIDRSELEDTRFWAPGECAECNGTGFKGRLAIHEVLIPDDRFRDAMLRSASSKELRETARLLPEFLTMQEDGLLKAAAGSTTLSEIIANAPRDTSPRTLSALKSIAKLRRTA